MLNTMFGLRFAVSAGRCTKGAFAQLVRVDETISSSTKCDFILVVDTEGIRSTESQITESQARDNEIATFVTGLADATLINVKGENPRHMQETLEIVVHAFLKMNSVDLKPSCVFVHQNIADISALEKNVVQRIELKEILDKAAKSAATEAHHNGPCPMFSDIINFEEGKHIAYVSLLWQGDPPMAPPNPGYSRCIYKVRRMLLTLMEELGGQTIDKLACRLNDLWDAILCEDFVFSFVNTWEIQAYSAMEVTYLQISRNFRKRAMECCNDLVTKCRTLSAKGMNKHGEKYHKDAIQELSDYNKQCFQTMRHQCVDILKTKIWWNNNKGLLTNLHTNLKKTMQTEFDIVKRYIIWKEKIDKNVEKYEKLIIEKAKQLVDQSKGSMLTETYLEPHFNDTWEDWSTTVPEFTDLIDIKQTLADTLMDTFSNESHIVQKVLDNCRKGKSEIRIIADDIVQDKKGFLEKVLPKNLPDFVIKNAENFLSDTAEVILPIIDSRKHQRSNCNENVIKTLVTLVAEKLENVPVHRGSLKFSKRGIARHTVAILWKLLPSLYELQEALRKKNDLRLYMNKEKKRLRDMFMDECMKTGIHSKVAHAVTYTLESAIEEAVKTEYESKVIDYLRLTDDHKNVLYDKKSFHAKMLIEMGETKKFNSFEAYLNDPAWGMSIWLSCYIKKALTMESSTKGESELQCIYDKRVSHHFFEAKTAIQTIGNNLQKPTCQLKDFWKSLSDQLKSISFTDQIPQNIVKDASELIIFKDVQDKLLVKLYEAKLDTSKKYDEIYKEGLLNRMIGAGHNYFRQGLLGCDSKCPFCKAPCDHIEGCTSHRTDFHRPQGVGGPKWDESNTLCSDLCTSVVHTDNTFFVKGKWIPFKEYKEVYTDWEIKPNSSSTLLYWKWFMKTHSRSLAKFYKCKEAEIPENWKNITWESAKADMLKGTVYDKSLKALSCGSLPEIKTASDSPASK